MAAVNDAATVGKLPTIEPAVATLCICLDAFACISDEIVTAVEKGVASERAVELLARFETLRGRVADATRDAAGRPFPGGPIGAELVASIKACNARIRAGTVATEWLLSYIQTVDRFGERFVVQSLSNFAAVASWPSAIRLRDAFRGRPAILVAAGPSLEKNVATIARFKGKAVIVAVSHAALALQRAGVVPDLCIATDAQDLSYHFDGVPVERLGALICTTSVHPTVFALPARRFFTIAANPAIDSWVYDGLEEDIVLSSSGSVANDAFSLLSLWGCDPIILVGQDLSFPDGRFYAASSCDGSARMALSKDGTVGVVQEFGDKYKSLGGADAPMIIRQVPGYYGGTLPTSFAFQKAWMWFVDAARALASQKTLLNCTEGGAYIEGMEHVPLAAAVARYALEEFDIEGILDSVVQQIDPVARRQQTLQRVKVIGGALAECMDKARQCTTLAKAAKTRSGLVAKLDVVEREFGRSLESVNFLSAMIQKDVRHAIAAGKRGTSANNGLDASLAVYAAVIRVAGLLREPLRKVEDTLNASMAHP